MGAERTTVRKPQAVSDPRLARHAGRSSTHAAEHRTSLEDTVGYARRHATWPASAAPGHELGALGSVPGPTGSSHPLLLQRKCACGSTAQGSSGECGDCRKKRAAGVQTKLRVSEPGDAYEQEADRAADQVMRMVISNEEDQKTAPLSGPLVQRRVSEVGSHSAEAPAIVNEVPRSPGQPLDAATRAFFEPRFGHDFSRVRVHACAAAEQAAREVSASAYTVGQHVVFAKGQYAPTTLPGRKLLAHELAHVLQQGDASLISGGQGSRSNAVASDGLVQRQSSPRPTSENVWGLPVSRSMCGCRQRVRDGIAWANTAGATYAACDTPANTTSSDVEACFNAAQPGTTVAGSTSPSGTMSLPPPSADPCQRVEDKATFVHETMHSRHANDIARAQGAAFFREWRRLTGDPNRLDTLRATFPAQVAAFEATWLEGHDWAQDEVNSYRWERRFLEDALAALNRIC